MTERSIEKTAEGVAYANKIGMFYRDTAEGKNIALYYDPDGLYALIHPALERMLQAGVSKEIPEGMTPETFAMRKRLAKLLRSTIDGLLLMGGDLLLNVLVGPGHPKPQKGDDRLDWYMDVFTRLGISYLMQNDVVLYGKTVANESDQSVIEVHRVLTRPVAATDSSAGDGLG